MNISKGPTKKTNVTKSPKAAPKLSKKAKLLKIRDNLVLCASKWIEKNHPPVRKITPKNYGSKKIAFQMIYGTMITFIGIKIQKITTNKKTKTYHPVFDDKRVTEIAKGELFKIAPSVIKNQKELDILNSFLDAAKPSTMENLATL